MCLNFEMYLFIIKQINNMYLLKNIIYLEHNFLGKTIKYCLGDLLNILPGALNKSGLT